MSANQSHKNRLNRFDDPNPAIATGKRLIAERKTAESMGGVMANAAQRNPSTNPAGKATYQGGTNHNVLARVLGGKGPYYTPKAQSMPDQGHAARLRGKRARWDKKP